MPQPLSEKTIAIVKATVPALEAHGVTITQTMYGRMFENPMIRDLFNQSHQGAESSQPKALAGAILAYAKNIEHLEVLAAAVERIAQKHAGLQILPEHYPYVAEALLGAIKEVLGDAATDEILAAWGEAYWFLADILIEREAAIYDETAMQEGGWRGWRTFEIVEKIQESDIIASFVLRPVDGKPIIAHKPGQYLTFAFDNLPGARGEKQVKRNYSISSAANGKSYRITVKREPHGLVSNWLHDKAEIGATLQVSPPAGEFFLAGKLERPVALLSGGVGITPMMAMLENLATADPHSPVAFVHGTQSGATHAFGEAVNRLCAQNANISARVFYETPRQKDEGKYFRKGLISPKALVEELGTDTDFYICGPKPMLRSLIPELKKEGVSLENIHYEFFGPADEDVAA